ncbi:MULTISPECIES: acyl-CoA dehydrogenase family protein [Pseudomonas]|jgi:alkylation response protein AidB-like acyl-CoA dehydrogenase|uniref:Acyl-CoA/acyl-ACP dehydrogenase n=2 Tax=Pseudomonas capeferrum TaxID=1495066 RepID=A0ABY7RF52_9PSED|nr:MULTISPECIES: acyl-CoA dehydrogenase family protein [Pseudomonas]KEY88048.1 acyl-CoA dehydrogenase [Pseudomonas capeferrum]MDD2065793.1 acyl-CoA/acyl-ACP dehydrogenase [Pseudomonas sp. 25571]MUT53590.1 acyl-CoA dehydrogenase [Pseudomonas sp. TDA1]UDU83490.1 acyl-CoA/acyl-ACP dehydrogenase [Pseudomonas sp. HN2-3]UPL09041.1 sulfur acquisition oxidoreductase, SfnB family [Pseudomonas sp. IsoF]
MLDPAFRQWLDANAEAIDQGVCDPHLVLAHIAEAQVLRIGVDAALGGTGGQVTDAVEAIAAIASRSLAAAFVCWGQRAFIEYLLQSPNQPLRERLLPRLLTGELAGATGLSNAMKFLSGIESLQVRGRQSRDGWQLEGRLHWVTNLRKSGFVVAAAIEGDAEGAPFVVAIPSEAQGLERSDDLQLMGLQSSNTAALAFHQVELGREWLLHENARAFLPKVRPAFLALQCGMAIGLARRALDEVAEHLQGRGSFLDEAGQVLKARLENTVSELKQGLLDERFLQQPAALFKLRITLAECAADAVQLELQASGGKAYLSEYGEGFARRWRESAFVPIVTPSLVQLRAELQRQAGAA